MSNEKIELLGQDNETFYKNKVINWGLSENDALDTIEDLISSIGREGYSQSLLSKVLLRLGHIPDRIFFQRK